MPPDATSQSSAPAAGAGTPAGPLFSYDVPQEVTYSGQSFIELALPDTYFVATSAGKKTGD